MGGDTVEGQLLAKRLEGQHVRGRPRIVQATFYVGELNRQSGGVVGRPNGA